MEESSQETDNYEDEKENKVPKAIPRQRKDFLIAASYVEDARIGRRSDFISSENELKFYHLYYHPLITVVLKILVISLLLLSFFEEPAVKGLALPWQVTITFEILILLFFTLRILHMKRTISSSRFYSDLKVISLILVLILCFLDIIVYIGLKMADIKCIRWSRILRPMFAINFPVMRQIRRSFRNMRRTLPDVFNVLVLLFFSLAIFALMAFKLFGGKNLSFANNQPYFSSYWNSVFDLYVLITTANNPDIMMPAFDRSSWYVLFFVVFLTLCFFIYMNIILAVIYNNYRKHLKNEVKKSIMNKQLQLSKAFDLVFTFHGKRKVITKKTFYELMEVLPTKRSHSLIHVLWIVLDANNSNVIGRKDFLKLADLLNVEVLEVKQNPSLCLKTFPFIYNSKLSLKIRKIVKSKYFRYLFDLLTIANAIVIGVSKSTSEWDDAAEWAFLSVFMIEIILKFYTFGAKRFFSRLWNVFDFFVIGSAFFLGIIEEILKGAESRLSLDVLLVLRVLRLVKVIGSVQRFKIVIDTINKILPSLFSYGSVILIIYYVFAIVGIEAFNGRIKYLGYDSQNFCGNVMLNGSDFWKDKYCNNNFNDLLHAFIVLFELTVVNQWHVIAYGFAAVTNPVARLYFLTFHLFCVTVVLNIFTAFVLEVFILEYFARQSDLETEVERKIHEIGLSTKSEKMRRQSTVSIQDLIDDDDLDSSEDEPDNAVIEMNEIKVGGKCVRKKSLYADRSQDTPVRFVISKKIKSVEVLLQKMFEKELSDELCEEELHKWASEEDFDKRRSSVWSNI